MTKIPLDKKMTVMPPIPREYLKIPLETLKRLKYPYYLKNGQNDPKTLRADLNSLKTKKITKIPQFPLKLSKYP